MRRFLLIVCAGIAVLGLSATALAGKPASFKAGSYSGKSNFDSVTVALKRGSCKVAAGQKKSPLKLCVALTKAPEFQCHTNAATSVPVTAFASPVQVPASGKLTQKTAVTQEGFPGGPPSTGEATFAVLFKKNGTATVTLGLTLNIYAGTQALTCAGSESFTTKVH